MGKIDQPEDAVHHSISKRDNGVYAAERQAVHGLLKKNERDYRFFCELSYADRSAEARCAECLPISLSGATFVCSVYA